LSDLATVLNKAALIRLAVFDVDGVLTNGDIIHTGNDQEIKVFHVHDGLGLKMLMRAGCEVAIITSRTSTVVSARMAELGIVHVLQGQEDKRAAMLSLRQRLGVDQAACAYTGDDLIDLPAMKLCGLSFAVANAHPLVRENADWTTEKPGGSGAVREICELLLKAQGKLDGIYADYLA
jgi:3-deoxy-D-manno-octulosonate 8-phosphate phosphatase (KDO 8-P phosphatase)